VLVDNAIGDVDGALQFLRDELGEFVLHLPEDSRNGELERARGIALEAVLSFQGFVQQLLSEASDEFALGRTAFEALLRDVHQIQFDADELNDLGQSTVADLESELARASQSAAGHPRSLPTPRM
jgi:hypothetical protein